MIDDARGEGAGAVSGEDRSGGRLGWKTPLVVLLLYGVVISGATYPRVVNMATSLPGFRVDPLCTIRMMKWYKSCVLEGKSTLWCPEVQHPVGFPLALTSPLRGQAALFFPLSFVCSDDYVCYNILWFFAFLFSGMSVFWLSWSVLRDRFAAGFGGLLAMLSTPMMMRGHGHLELMFAGSMALFLAAWVGWVDRPRRGGLFLVVGTYFLSALSAAYFAVLLIVPAALYVGWRMAAVALDSGWRGGVRWLSSRAGWFAAFVVLSVPGLLAVFSSHIYGSAMGLNMERSLSAFVRYGSPAWSYVVPTGRHAASVASSTNPYATSGFAEIESASYLGVAALMLLAYAAVRRVSFPRAGYWWLVLGSAVVLSLGAYADLGSHRVPLPALWLRRAIPVFSSLRAPCRFNLLSCMIAGLIAAAGLRRLMDGARGPRTRALIGVAAVALVVGDLSMVPYASDPSRPPQPGAYDWIKARNPRAAILEAPLLSSGCPHPLTETCAYWQSNHGLRTTAGYSGFINTEFDDLMVDHSPFSAETLLDPSALGNPDSLSVGVVSDVSVRDYAWLLARRARLDYLVLHGWDESVGVRSPAFARLIDALKGTLAFAEFKVLVFDFARLDTPTRPVLICDQGMRPWRGRPGPPIRVMGRSGRLTAYVPEPGGRQIFTIEARGFRRPRTILLKAEGATLARWEVVPSEFRTLQSTPISLPAGIQALTLESDGEDAPDGPGEFSAEWDTRPYGLQILKVGLRPATGP